MRNPFFMIVFMTIYYIVFGLIIEQKISNDFKFAYGNMIGIIITFIVGVIFY